MPYYALDRYDRIHELYHDNGLDKYWDIVRDFLTSVWDCDIKRCLLAYGKLLERINAYHENSEVLKSTVSAMYSICFADQDDEALDRIRA